MKRVVRNVIKLVTTVHWLPEVGEQPAHLPAQVVLETAAGPPATNSDNASAPVADSTEQLTSYVCSTYIFIYRVLEH